MREVIGSVYDYRYDKDLNVFGQAVGFLFRPETESRVSREGIRRMEREERMGRKEKAEKTEFELSGLIAEELEMMGRKERIAIMKRAGLNPELYDF